MACALAKMRLRRHHPEVVTVDLDFRVALDRDWLTLGHSFMCVRLMARVEFNAPGPLPLICSAILDTGSPITVVPRYIWEQADVTRTGQPSTMEGGLSGRKATGELGLVPVRITDRTTASPPLTLRALLLQDDSVPLVLGFGDLLTQVRFHCDFPASRASLEFPLHSA